MTVEFLIGMFAGAVLSFLPVLLIYLNRRAPGDIWDWSEDAYEPRRSEPRAITRVTSNNIDWEIK